MEIYRPRDTLLVSNVARLGKRVAHPCTRTTESYYRAFHRFAQAKFPDGGSILGTSQFSMLPQLPPKILLDSKVVKIDRKIIVSLH